MIIIICVTFCLKRLDFFLSKSYNIRTIEDIGFKLCTQISDIMRSDIFGKLDESQGRKAKGLSSQSKPAGCLFGGEYSVIWL